jgi:hypothetical protein
MEARFLRAALLAAVVVSLGAGRPYYSVRSQHFIVSAPTPQLAEEICQAAEQCRRELAIEWLGHELPEWQGPCPIQADVAQNLGAGGATSFVFHNNTPSQWTMRIQGSRERVLDSVLPHEITHTIFATHFGRPLPRWADEGACTTVEHDSEKVKQDKYLIQFLTSSPSRGIAFNRMFQMKEYPPDILPLYSQGYSLARFFIEQGGKPKFVEYVGEGMRTNNWTAATRNYYGFGSLSELQVTWVEWVRKGSPELAGGVAPAEPLVSRQPAPATSAVASRMMSNTQMASLTQQPRSRIPDGALASWQTTQAQNARVFAQAEQHPALPIPANFARPAVVPAQSQAETDYSSVSRPISDGWYAKRRDQAQSAIGPAAPAETFVPQPPSVVPESPVNEPPVTPPTTRHVPPPPTHRTAIEAEPLTPVGALPAQVVASSIPPGGLVSADSSGSEIVLEWTRPADQAFRGSGELTGVAIHDRSTMLR